MIQAIPTYVMGVYKIPSTIIQKLNLRWLNFDGEPDSYGKFIEIISRQCARSDALVEWILKILLFLMMLFLKENLKGWFVALNPFLRV